MHAAPRVSIDRPLHTGWRLREVDPALCDADNFVGGKGWLPATVPGTVYQDLIAAGRIPDPHFGRNEAQVQWVAERDWAYRLDFSVDESERRDALTLAFDGLDTFAQVWLNGERVLVSDNMFVPARVDVTQRLRSGHNTLCIRFDSALRRGRELEAHHGQRPLWNGDSSRLYVRKAPYHYGWDWGPTLLTAGPWQAVRLEAHDLRLAELDSPVWLADDLQRARIDVHTHLEGRLAGAHLRHRLLDPDGQRVAESIAAAAAQQTASLAVPAPHLWWPSGHGEQPLYTLVTEALAHDGTVVCHQQRRLGLRRLRLVQDPVASEPGRSFHFEVNGREIFAGGANWIPDDNLLNRITPARYRERVAQAAAAHMVMLRVWGGGIYERDEFYDACDEFGVLVWQDFVFACGLYPAYPAYLASVEAEARAAITRLRHRASLALWCGNNEDYMLAESVGAYGPGKDLARFDARAIYEDLLPTLCGALDPGRPYWPGSPYTSTTEGQWPSQDPSIGDRHSWEVWHQLMLPYAQYAKVGARFVSEFGMQSHPSLALLEASIPEADRFPGSRTMQWHNKAFSPVGADGHRRLAVYAADTLRAPNTLAGEVYATQFVQAEAMRHAFEAFRRGWRRGGARACGGALVWQLNDCWPVTSWALIDSAGQPKPAWYATRRALAPVACALRRPAGDASGRTSPWSAWAVSHWPDALAVRAVWQRHALDGHLVTTHTEDLTLAANGSTELSVPADWHDLAPDTPEIATLSLHPAGATAATSVPLTRAQAWPEPFRWYRFPDPDIDLQTASDGALLLRAQRPAKGVWIHAPRATLADNFLDLLPGETVRIGCSGLPDEVSVRCLNTVQDPTP